jgi:hypothetical protein
VVLGYGDLYEMRKGKHRVLKFNPPVQMRTKIPRW